MLRTSLSSNIETELDETLNEVITAMKDKLCSFLGGNEGGKMAKYFGTASHELADKIVDFITASGFDDDMSGILRGFRFLASWRMSYRSFLQHRLRACLNNLDPLDAEAMSVAGYPGNSQEASEQLLELYRQAVANLREAFAEKYGMTFTGTHNTAMKHTLKSALLFKLCNLSASRQNSCLHIRSVNNGRK